MCETDVTTHTARHMRNDRDPEVVASIGATTFTSLAAAFEAGQGKHICIQHNCVIDEPITIFTAGTTLDLNDNTIVFVSPEFDNSTDSTLPSLCITAPGTRIQNGRIAVLSGAEYAVCLKRVAHKAEVRFDNVALAYEGSGYALRVVDGIALLQNSRIESSNAGIQVCSNGAHVGMSASRVITQKRAVTISDGRLFSDSSHIAARDSDAIVVERGYLGVYSSEVGSHDASAIRTRVPKDVVAPPRIKICECSDITSVLSYGLFIVGGTVTVLRSMVRSLWNTAISMGTESFVPTRLSLIGGSKVSSWRSKGIERQSGILYLNNSSVNGINGSENHQLDNASFYDDYAFDLAEPAV